MEEYKLGIMETKFSNLIWDREPIPSGELVKLCEKEFDWKKSTTYTMLKRLCDRNIFKNQDGLVSAVLTKEDFYALQSEKFVEDTFKGSLPKFLAAFSRRRKLSQKELEELQDLIDQYKG